MKPNPSRSIVFYVIALLVITVTLSLGVYGFINYSEIKKSHIENLKKTLSLEVNQLSIALALPGWNLDSGGVERIIESFLLDQNISAVIVDIGDEEKIIIVRDSNWASVKSKDIPVLISGFEESRKIIFNNEEIGNVRLQVTMKFIDEKLMGTIIQIVLFTLLLDLILILLLYYLLNRNVLKPISEIEQYALTLSSDEKKIAPKLKISRYSLTELQSLATSIENMVRQLVKAKLDAERAANIKSQFLDIATHELKTPVAALSLLTDMTSLRLSNGIRPEVSDIDRIKKQTTRLKTLVEDLLNVSSMERGFLVTRTAPTDIGLLVEENVKYFRAQVPSRFFVFEEPYSPIVLTIDPERITQVLTNLLNNAINYTPNDTEIEISIVTMPTKVRVSIIDHGPGIPKELQEKLFTRFFRATSNETAVHPGLGLGLYISRRILETHGGTLDVISEEGKGSTFYFELPRNG